MRRTHGLVIALLALLLLGVVAARNLPAAAGHPAQGISTTDVGAPAATTDDPNYTRKLPPPADSVKPAPPAETNRPSACSQPVVNVSQQSSNEDESYVVVNPTNPNNIVAFSNLTTNSIFRAYTMNGGTTWTRGTVATNVACCDGQAAFDTFGNLFMVYINNSVNQINVVLSTDGGVTFSAPVQAGTGSIDQPSIAVGNGSVWVDWNLSGSMRVRGAPVTGLGAWGPFNAVQTPPGATGSFGGIAVGPGPNGGKVIITYMNPTGGQGPATIFANVDTDGLGAGNFGPQVNVSTTNVGGFDYIPAQSGRSIDTEAGVVWDGTGGPFNDRIYLIYTEETVNENNDTEIYLRTSTNDGTTWSAPVRVNDDPLGPIRSQFLPYIALDRSTGTVAAGWQDSRNDNGVPGSGGTNNIPNDDAEYYASYSTNGGVTWAPNQMLSGGFSNAAAAAAPVDYGDYEGEDAAGGKFVAVWADNTNCDGTNPNGTLHAFDLYMGTMALPAQGTPTPTRTGTPPTATRTSTPTNTVQATNTPTPSLTPCVIAPIEGFESGTLGTYTSTVGTCVPGGCGWASVTTAAHSGTRSAFAPDLANITDQYLTTISAVNVPAGATLSFWHRWDLESGFDGAVLEFSTNGGSTWTDGGAMITMNGYNGSISSSFQSPISGRQAWTGNPNGTTFVETRANLSSFAGMNLLIRFRTADDNSVSATGWWVDDIAILGSCASPTPGTPSATATNTPPPTSTAPPTNTASPTSAVTNTPTITPIPTSCPVQFNDVPVGSTFYDFIRCLACRGIVNGYPCGGPFEPCPGNYFRPNNNVTRGQVSKIVSESAGFAEVVPSTQWTFQDVPPSGTFWLWVERLSGRGIIGGYACGSNPFEPCVAPNNRPYFRPNNDVTRGQLSKIVSGAAGWTETPTGQTFEDVAVGSTFYVYVERIASRGIVSGYPCGNPGEPCVAPGNRPYFRPFNNATRGQMSKIAASAFFPGCSTPAKR